MKQLLLILSLELFAVEHIRVIFTEDPSSKATILWTQRNITKTSPIEIISDGQKSSLTPKIMGKMREDTLYIHSSKVENLKENSKVTILDRSNGKTFYFKTAPKSGPFKLIFGGDSRSDRRKRRVMNRLIREKMVSEDILALVHGGDFVASGEQMGDWHDWLDDNKIVKAKDGRILPIIPTRGNHERNSRTFSKIFGFPANHRHYYLTKIGPLALFTLNTEISMAGSQREWLLKTLRNTDSKFLVGNYHRPAYPAVKFPSNALKYWVPIFDRYNFDLVFESDGHAFKRTVPIKHNKKHPDGTIYVGEGGLGVKQRIPMRQFMWYLRSPGYAVSLHHIFILEVKDHEMILRPHSITKSMKEITFKPKFRKLKKLSHFQ